MLPSGDDAVKAKLTISSMLCVFGPDIAAEGGNEMPYAALMLHCGSKVHFKPLYAGIANIPCGIWQLLPGHK